MKFYLFREPDAYETGWQAAQVVVEADHLLDAEEEMMERIESWGRRVEMLYVVVPETAFENRIWAKPSTSFEKEGR